MDWIWPKAVYYSIHALAHITWSKVRSQSFSSLHRNRLNSVPCILWTWVSRSGLQLEPWSCSKRTWSYGAGMTSRTKNVGTKLGWTSMFGLKAERSSILIANYAAWTGIVFVGIITWTKNCGKAQPAEVQTVQFCGAKRICRTSCEGIQCFLPEFLFCL